MNQPEISKQEEFTPNKVPDSPDTKASTGQTLTPEKDINFKPMKGNLNLTPLKFQHILDKEERSQLARQEYSRL